MKSLHDQIAHKCVHFTGIMNKQCKLGIAYADVRVNDQPYKFPCLKQCDTCGSALFPTEDEVQQRILEIDGSAIKSVMAMIKIKEHVKKTKEQSGKVECDCGGELKYIVASVNGHVHAKCSGCGLSIME